MNEPNYNNIEIVSLKYVSIEIHFWLPFVNHQIDSTLVKFLLYSTLLLPEKRYATNKYQCSSTSLRKTADFD